MYPCKFGQNICTSSEDNTQKLQSAPVILKIMSWSPKSIQLFPFSQQCIYESLVKIHQLVQKIMHGNEKAEADADSEGVHT